MIPLLLPLLLGGCLERTTGEARSLDPRFFANAPGSASGSPDAVEHHEVAHGAGEGGDAAHGEVEHHEVEHHADAKPPGPFDDHEGPAMMLRGRILSEASGAVQLDFKGADPDSEAKLKQLGMLFLDGPGPFELQVPVNFGALSIEAFQDPEGDGPSDADPFGAVSLELGVEPIRDLTITLEPGGRLLQIAAQGGAQMSPFKDHDGPWTTLSGVIAGGGAGEVAMDLRGPDPSSPTGDTYLGKVRLAGTGAYRFDVPRGLGALTVEAFQDAGGDGPDASDPYARVSVEVGDVEAIEQDFQLVEGAWSPAPVGGGGSSAPPPGGLSGDAAPLFAELGEGPVTVSGVIELGAGVNVSVVDLDIFSADPDAPGGRRFLGKLKVAPGAFSFQAPRGAGALELEAFADPDADGPTPGDPFGKPTEPVVVRQKNISDITIRVGGSAG